jgi:iron complex outermembrane receptor protein
VPGAAAPAPTGEVRGTVVAKNDGRPLGDASVALGGSIPPVEVGVDGGFHIRNLPAGPQTLHISALGYVPATAEVIVDPARVSNLTVSLEVETRLSETVLVTASGRPETAGRLAHSVGVIEREDLAVNHDVGLSEVLNAVPGVKAESQNETQEVRVSIRGRGVRTAFGVRSIRMLIDGIPESDATGETPDLTGPDLGAIDRIEIVKGPMAAQYGASSSGVVNLISQAPSPTPLFEARGAGGSYGFFKGDLSAAGPVGPLSGRINVSHVTQDGYREHSHLDATRVGALATVPLGTDTELMLSGRGSWSNSQLPGNLDAESMARDRRQASGLFTVFDAQSNIDRGMLGAQLRKSWAAGRQLTVSAFGHDTSFDVPVPFVYLSGKRLTGGGSVRYSFPLRLGGLSNTVLLGGEGQYNSEDRHDYTNEGGLPGSSAVRDEDRRLGNVGAFVLDTLDLSKGWSLRAGLNYSRVTIDLKDFVLDDGNDSGNRGFDRLSYHVGLVHQFGSAVSLFASTSSGFDPPTISEIGRNPDGGGGLNRFLMPELSTNYEMGTVMNPVSRVALRVSVFRLNVDDEIVPTGTGYPQEVFANAAKTVHKGIEAGTTLTLAKGLNLLLGYTYSDFKFEDYQDEFGNYSGNLIPGIPKNRFEAAVHYGSRGVTGGVRWRSVGALFADDSNTVEVSRHQLLDAWLGGEKTFGKVALGLTIRASNITDELYSDYIVVNDRFHGYYYPSAERSFSAFLTIRTAP